VTQSNTPQADVDAAAERIRELNEQILAYGREAGLSYLEAYEATVKTFADYHEQAAGATGIEWMTTVARAQADFVRELTKATTAAARETLK
jgi:hypothetical protein